MKNIISIALLAIFLALPTCLRAYCCYGDLPTFSQQLSVGPEIYHLKRIRKQGTLQHGMMYGVRASYDRIKRYKYYWGVEAAYAEGAMRGHSTAHARLKSHFSDAVVEARVGYTFQSKSATCASLTPFIGLGAFLERNKYVHPSPVKLQFKNTFYYLAFGALSKAYVNPHFSIGVNITAKYSLDGRVRVSHDPEFEDISLHYEHKLQCRVAIPFTYEICFFCVPSALCVTPFYEFRHFGGLHQVPFNFNDTRLKVHGVNFFYMLRF